MRYATFLFVLMISALLAACAFSGGSSAASLQGEWTLSTLNGKAPLAGTTITATFEKDTVGGRSGCNSYGGSFTARGNKLSASELAMTEMYCMDPEGVMDQETAYLQALSQAASFSVENGQLEIHDASENTVLVFVKK
jgi:heat shock protein HslJ